MSEQILNKHQLIAAKRIKEIESATIRIQAKIDAEHPRSEDYKKRLAQYAESMKLLEFTLETGRPVKFKGDESEDGVTIAPPAGAVKLEGQN